jgi:hypothetical protein
VPPLYRRREFVGSAAGATVAAGLGLAFWRDLFAAGDAPHARAVRDVPSLYGARRAPDANGIRLPKRFRSRVIARGGDTVPGTDYTWHALSDGASTFAVQGGERDPLRRGRLDPGRLPDPLRDDSELLGRRHAVGHVAVV